MPDPQTAIARNHQHQYYKPINYCKVNISSILIDINQSQLTPVYAVYKQRKYQPYRLTALLNHFENKLQQKIIY